MLQEATGEFLHRPRSRRLVSSAFMRPCQTEVNRSVLTLLLRNKDENDHPG